MASARQLWHLTNHLPFFITGSHDNMESTGNQGQSWGSSYVSSYEFVIHDGRYMKATQREYKWFKSEAWISGPARWQLLKAINVHHITNCCVFYPFIIAGWLPSSEMSSLSRHMPGICSWMLMLKIIVAKRIQYERFMILPTA